MFDACFDLCLIYVLFYVQCIYLFMFNVYIDLCVMYVLMSVLMLCFECMF